MPTVRSCALTPHPRTGGLVADWRLLRPIRRGQLSESRRRPCTSGGRGRGQWGRRPWRPRSSADYSAAPRGRAPRPWIPAPPGPPHRTGTAPEPYRPYGRGPSRCAHRGRIWRYPARPRSSRTATPIRTRWTRCAPCCTTRGCVRSPRPPRAASPRRAGSWCTPEARARRARCAHCGRRSAAIFRPAATGWPAAGWTAAPRSRWTGSGLTVSSMPSRRCASCSSSGPDRTPRPSPGSPSATGPVRRSAAPPRASTAPPGRSGTGWRSSTSWAAPKQNRYLYAPGDDPYRQARWRDPYPAERRAEFRELATRARANHVTLGWAVSPGQEMCFSSDSDMKALLKKVDAMWALGVRSFQLQFQDVSYSEWHCGKDADTFGSGPEAAAKAQAKMANAVARHLAGRHPDAAPLSLMPTEYFQDGDTEFRRALAADLDTAVEVAWTGVGVVPRTITGGELADARSAFGHRLVTMDNYPVNDYAQDRIFLGPYTGRDPAVATQSAALLANAMEQPTASRIPLFTAADFAWNPRGYRPQESWQAAIDDLAGPDDKTRAALHALAGNDASSVLGGDESAYLRPLTDAFWAEVGRTDVGRLDRAADRLRAAFATMRDAPERLSGMLGDDVRPWLDQLGRYGDAGVRAVDMLTAQAHGDGDRAWTARLAVEGLREKIADSRVTVGKGVLDPFLKKALTQADDWSGVKRSGKEKLRTREADHAAADGKATTTVASPGKPVTVRFGRTRPLASVSALTGRSADGAGTVEAHVPGEGWRRLGALAADGFTQVGGKGIRADAVRLSWAAGTTPATVHEITPWFADTPAAELRLSRGSVDAEVGGRSATVRAELTSLRPGDVNDDLKLRAPHGITARAPEGVTAPRGATATARIEISVDEGTKPGTYAVPVRFGSEQRMLTVRALPRTGGPDLARAKGTKATSSGDETPDFPASAAIDGDSGSRWSSPAEDGAWLQLELARPAHVGRLDLRWQDAYASRYRVQVSADGRTWRTAATVTDGQGGREMVGLDAPDTRFIRIQGIERGTRFGYSLWSVAAYAVEETKGKKPGKD
ncbi:putative secreted protein [Streptomyces himastatinicus ATCC 53653]|uniref:Putative secreted protein n=1 Tax=Streptomyces himastatinicus ATCC 53653 TaxID=457427 RepID=D9WQD8_9ACTN|nr:putative secreted protein [Streptomyces himastatinicus ATCC 53653]